MTLLRSSALVLLALLAVVAMAACGDEEESGGAAEFAYVGAEGPSHWADLDPAYEECRRGRRQSPVDLSEGSPSNLAPLLFSYEEAELEVENNGHSLEAEYPAGSTLELDGRSYELKQFHFHAPSEHHLRGGARPMEFHLVHEADGGELLVLGVLVEEGRPNRAVETLVEALPGAEGETLRTGDAVNALDLLPPEPERARRWEYLGSLTTPPCSEGVAWNVFDEPIELSAEQIDAYTGVYEGTNRPVQPLDGRTLRLSR